MEDSKIIALYFARDEEALVQTDRKYGRYCHALAQSVLGNEEDAEEVVSDTYWKTWESIPPTRPVVLKLFLAKITRNLAFTRWRANTAEKRGGGRVPEVLEELEECVGTSGTPEEQINGRELSNAIRSFLDTLPLRERQLFLHRYFSLEETDTLALRYGMRPDTVRRSLSRTRAKLKNYLKQEGYEL